MHEAMLKTIQVISGALMLGIVAFAALVVALRLSGQTAQQPDLLGVYGPAVAAAWAGGFVAQLVVWTSQRAALQKEWTAGKLDEQQLAARYQTLMIVRLALLESGALFGVVATLLTGSWLTMAAPAASLLVMAAIFPSKGRWEDFCESAKRGI